MAGCVTNLLGQLHVNLFISMKNVNDHYYDTKAIIKVENKKVFVSVPEASLLELVALKLRNVILFSEKLEKAKEFLEKVKIKTT